MGALDANSPSESSSSSKSSSRLGFAVSVAVGAGAGLGASSIVASCDSGSGLISSACDISVEDASADVDSGDTECGMLTAYILCVFNRCYAVNAGLTRRTSSATFRVNWSTVVPSRVGC